MTLKQMREDKGLMQKYVAKKLHITRVYLGYIESGKRNISMDIAVSLATMYNTSYGEIIQAWKESRDLCQRAKRSS